MANVVKRPVPSADKAPSALQRPAPRMPQGQQATTQQQGTSPPAGNSKPSPVTGSKGNANAPSPTEKPNRAPNANSTSASPQGNPSSSPLGPKPPSGAPEQTAEAKGPAPGPGPAQPMPLEQGPSKELSSAINFLMEYIKNGMPNLPSEMLNGMNPEIGPSALDQIGTKLPTTVAGDIKTFPKYSLATGSPTSPNLPTGLTIPQTSVSEPNLIAGLPKSQVQIQQMRINNV
jgi:hypothetical protein